jgi:hypothetical protein
VAKDRGRFSNYTPIKSYVSNIHNNTRLDAVGIGRAHLQVKKHSGNGAGRHAHTILVLENVLHVPSQICNIVGVAGGLEHYLRDCTRKRRPVKDSTGRALFCWDSSHMLNAIKLSGPPLGPRVGPSVFTPGYVYFINSIWSNEERIEWKGRMRGAKMIKPLQEDEKKKRQQEREKNPEKVMNRAVKQDTRNRKITCFWTQGNPKSSSLGRRVVPIEKVLCIAMDELSRWV